MISKIQEKKEGDSVEKKDKNSGRYFSGLWKVAFAVIQQGAKKVDLVWKIWELINLGWDKRIKKEDLQDSKDYTTESIMKKSPCLLYCDILR